MEEQIDKGFIKLKRAFMDWEWYQDGNTSRLMIHLLLKSNFKTKNWQGYVISPGELITSLDNLSNELNISIGMIRNSLKKLKNGKYIAIKTTNRFTMIRILKSDIYDEFNYTINKQKSKQTIIVCSCFVDAIELLHRIVRSYAAWSSFDKYT